MFRPVGALWLPRAGGSPTKYAKNIVMAGIGPISNDFDTAVYLRTATEICQSVIDLAKRPFEAQSICTKEFM